MATRQSLKIDVAHVLDRAALPGGGDTGQTRRAVTTRGELIAAQAIDFFNELGASRVSINQLAQSLGMSPGNLHYHFRANSDLYRTLFDILDRDIRAILLRPCLPMTLDDIVQHQIDTQTCLWRHRYFFRDLDYLVNSDPGIFVEFLHLQNWAVDQLITLRRFYERHFNLKPIEAPNSDLEVAQNTWMMWMSWIRWEAIANAKTALSQVQLDEIFYRLAWHHFSLHGPYISQRVALALALKLKQKLLS